MRGSILAATTLLALGASACKATHPAVAPTSAVRARTPAVQPATSTPRSALVTPSLSPTRLPVPSTTVVARVGTPGLVTIAAGRINPDAISVAAGRPITFQNGDSSVHQIVSNEPGLFDTGPIAPGASAQVTVTPQGFHDYHDAASPALKGTIRILP